MTKDAGCVAEIEVQISKDAIVKFTVEVQGDSNKDVIRKILRYVDEVFEVLDEREKE